MVTHVVLFTRDLRVHDHPALAAAAELADRVAPLFVLDERVQRSGYVSPNRASFLVQSLEDLDRQLQGLGGGLVIRSGDVVEQVARLVDATGATAVHATRDVSRFAQSRQRELQRELAAVDVALHLHPGVTVVPPGELTTSAREHYKVFTPYWNVWREQPLRDVVAVPQRVRLPDGVRSGRVPRAEELASGERSPHLPTGGEQAGRARLDEWFDRAIGGYDDGRDRLADDATSRLSPYLHLGTVSPREIVGRLDLRRRGHESFLRQLCWRDFHHQVAWAHPTIGREEYRPRGDRWDDDPEGEAFVAWREGRTGYPIVDAAMRQLRREGWIHNRARMVAASFLVKDLYVDWRLGADHFLRWLVDGDVVNNAANWQWIAGTGTDTRPNRVYNPIRQARRFDPDGDYVRRYVTELASVRGAHVHTPWQLERDVFAELGYPAPLVDHDLAVAQFREARGVA